MYDPLYLLSTVHTLTQSLHYLSVHDVLDAYATFVNRITAHADLLQVSDTPPALALLSAHKDNLTRVLRRDVRRIHLDPLLTGSPLRLDQSSGLHPHTKITSKQLGTDTFSLCHYALRALTVIFRFPAFSSVFSEHDLSSLFGDVLDATLGGCLQEYDQMQTLSHSLCILSCHRLSAAVLISRQSDVFSVLHQGLDGARQPADIVLDGLKAISHTIELCPSEFLHLLSPLLSRVMASLFCESFELRLHASIALGKFANALVSQSELSMMEWNSLSNHIISFLESHCDKSQADSEDTSFLRTVRMDFSSESHPHPRLGPAWMFAVLASLIVLCGSTLYKKPPILGSILQSLAIALTHKRSVIRVMHPHVWKCLVWTFGRMLLSTESVEPAVISFAFHVVNQEVSGGIGIALVNVLLSDRIPAIHSDERGERVSRALSVIKEMVQTECKHTRREGLVFLQALAGNAQARHQITQNMCEIPASILLNGVIIGADWSGLSSAIHSIPKVPVTVHWLEGTEVAQHHKTLLVIWKLYAVNVDRKELDPCLVDVWLFILLACSRQLEHGQLAPTSEVLGYFATTITEFLPSAPFGEGQPDCESSSVQLSTLNFIDKLWSAMRQAFVAISLAEAAEFVLTSVLKNVFRVFDLDVRASWGRFCASLIVAPSPSLLCDIHVFTVLRSAIQSQHNLWGVVATSLSSCDPGLGWKELAKFLCIPICSWVLSDPELKAWDALFRDAVTISGDSLVVAEILQFGQGKEVENWESIIPVLGFILTSTREHGHSPSDELLSIINICLTTSYSRARHSAEALTPSLELLNAVRCMMISVASRMMHNIRALSSSLCLWIEDHAELMSDNEFNSVVVVLYCQTLEVLATLPLSIQSLQDMEDFLASAFSRIPTPAIAPFFFEKFWRATYHARSQFHHILPPKIKSCLTCFVAAYGGDLADGLSLTIESQSQIINDGSQAHFPTDRPHQNFGRSNALECPSSISIQAGARSEAIDMEVASYGHCEVSTSQEDTTFLVPSPDDAPQPAALYENMASRSDVSEQSPHDSQVHVSQTSPFLRAIPTPGFQKKLNSMTTHALNQKRKLAEGDATPRKRSRTSRATLRAFRKLESEPATRDVTPTDVPRMNSVPLKKRMVFDGVQVPTLRSVIQRQKMSERAETGKDPVGAERRPVFLPKTPTSRGTHERERTSPTTLPSSVGSDEENFDWEDFHIDGTSSEIDVDRCLEEVTSSPLQAQTSTPHGNEHPSGMCLLKAMSQNEISPSPSPRPSLRRAKTTSARLDALRDVYSAVANGASQIPMSELVQATRLVHQIGAMLTDQMGKKMGGQ